MQSVPQASRSKEEWILRLPHIRMNSLHDNLPEPWYEEAPPPVGSQRTAASLDTDFLFHLIALRSTTIPRVEGTGETE